MANSSLVMAATSCRPNTRAYNDFLQDGVASDVAPSDRIGVTDLCSTCQGINFKALLSMETENLDSHGSFILDLKASVQELKASTCRLCRLFASVSPSDYEDDGIARADQCHLRAFSSNAMFVGSERRNTPLLAVLRSPHVDSPPQIGSPQPDTQKSLQETGFLAISNDPPWPNCFGCRLLDPEVFNLRFAKDCIEYCRSQHWSNCQSHKEQAMPDINFQLIDCKKKTIVSASLECPYVALSYVWGEPSDDYEFREKNLPQLIKDSMETVLSLGFEYLWVDRYCIRQSDKQDKATQIRHMDAIYAGAELTIIAASGENPHYGLPGVSRKDRSPQPVLQVGHHRIVATLPHPSWLLRKSKWNTRGWTYQEGLLSRRRLLFFEQQVVYECNGMHCAESTAIPMKFMHSKRQRRFNDSVPPGSFSHEILQPEPWTIMSYISEYSQRQLSYPSDALNAIQAILRVFERNHTPVYNVLGVPLLSPIPPPARRGTNGTEPQGMPRSPKECFLIGLCWFTRKPGQRRGGFPSWSWAGWTGAVEKYLLCDRTRLAPLSNIPVRFQSRDGSLAEFPAEFSSLPQFLADPSRNLAVIEIEALMADCRPRYRQRNDVLMPNGWYVVFPIEANEYIYAAGYPDGIPDQTLTTVQSSYKAVILADSPHRPPGSWAQNIVNYAAQLSHVPVDTSTRLVSDHLMSNPTCDIPDAGRVHVANLLSAEDQALIPALIVKNTDSETFERVGVFRLEYYFLLTGDQFDHLGIQGLEKKVSWQKQKIKLV
ncbi:heterokaryon incompatibility protein-domain-containing protein [Xylaria grammica]|nr:heterokaryon incompatibility protein-domain-containing protein [Xylaria grammica]